MSILAVGDLHARESGPFAVPQPGGLDSRFGHLLDVLAQVERYAEEYKPDDVVLLGDITHRRHFIRFRLLNPLIRTLDRLAESCGRLSVLVGNHDLEDDEGTHALTALDGRFHTYVYEDPTLVRLLSGADALMLPYTDHDLIVRAIENSPSNILVFGHYGAEGVPLANEYWLDSPLKLGELAKFSRVVFGHIHQPSEQLDGKVINVGAAMHLDFGDVGPRRCIFIPDSGPVQSLPLIAPTFNTVTFPRLRPHTGDIAGFLRILNVPRRKAIEVREEALRLGWADAVTVDADIPETVRAAVMANLHVNEVSLAEWLRRAHPQLDETEHAAVLEEGIQFLRKARG